MTLKHEHKTLNHITDPYYMNMLMTTNYDPALLDDMTLNQVFNNVTTMSTKELQALRKMAREAEAERKLDPDTYAKCPRCYGRHSIHGNFDNLCDSCKTTILTHFPNHETVPQIKAALSTWLPTATPKGASSEAATP